MEKMFIPKRLKVGFINKDGTFSGKLAYIIYYDEKGKLRKETSWKNWCNESLGSVEFDNVPQAGYLFNKGVKRDGYWGSGRSVIRVYDPRDFEFEISVDNLMGILMHSDVSKRDIVEECVFAWQGKELVLLPINSQEYLDSVEYTKKQDQKLSAKDLVEGYVYQAKKSDLPLTYIGYREWFEVETGYEKDGKLSYKYYSSNSKTVTRHSSKGKKHIFYNGTVFVTKTVADLSAILSSEIVEDYSAIVDKFFTTINSQKIVQVSGINKSKDSYYNDYLYLISNNNLITIKINTNNHYNGNNNYSYSLELNTYAQNIIVGDKFELIGYHYSLGTEFNDLQKEFNQQFLKQVTSEELKDLKKEVKSWLKERNVFSVYCFILENGTVVPQAC